MKVKVAQSVWLFATPWTAWTSPGQNTGVGSLSLLQGIFPTQGANPGLPYCRQILYQLSHRGNPRILEWVAYPFSSESSWPRQSDSLPTELSRNSFFRDISKYILMWCNTSNNNTWVLNKNELPRWLSGKESACQYRRFKRHGFDPWVGKVPREGNGNSLQYSCLENPMDNGAWRATVHGVAKSWTWLPSKQDSEDRGINFGEVRERKNQLCLGKWEKAFWRI